MHEVEWFFITFTVQMEAIWYSKHYVSRWQFGNFDKFGNRK